MHLTERGLYWGGSSGAVEAVGGLAKRLLSVI